MHPWWLLALPLALLPWIAHARPWAMRYAAISLQRPTRSWRAATAWVPPLLQSAAIALTVVALARPQEVMRETLIESNGIDIVLAMDTSGSMDTPDMGAAGRDLARLEAAKRVAQEFVRGREHDRIGLVVFGQEAFWQVPLTLDHDALDEFIGQLQVGMAGKAATAVGDAVAVAAKRMKELEAPSRVVILVTDGSSNAGQIDPVAAATAAGALGIRVHTIGVGSASGGGLLGMLGGRGASIDEPLMRAISGATGAKYWRADDTAALAQVYGEIDAMEKSTAQVKEYVHRDERYLLALFPALACLVAELVASATAWRRLP
jgi:Ca-activated chloride channel family protein